MEHHRPQPDARLIRAARSLHHNRRQAELVDARLARAEAHIASWLELSGLTQAMLGMFRVTLVGERVQITKLVAPDGAQPPLPAIYPPTAPASIHGVAEVQVPLPERLTPLSEGEMALLARGMLAALSSAELAPLLARHEAGRRLHAPADVYALLAPEMACLTQEQLRALTLTTRHDLLGNHLIYQGTATSTHVRPMEVFRPAILQHAQAVIVAHNHPSGDPSPSPEDMAITRALARAAKTLDVEFVDHIVVAASGFYSFRERGHLPIDTRD